MARIVSTIRPSSTSFEAAYLVETDSDRATINKINIANVSNVDSHYSIAAVLAGETPTEATALAWNVKVPTGSTRVYEFPIPMDDFGERIMVRSSVANALNFTLLEDG
ncbi:MAG: hypothetical protein ACYTEQ_06455 [Planctomycetota bacterium]|jgi:hypothetical protein